MSEDNLEESRSELQELERCVGFSPSTKKYLGVVTQNFRALDTMDTMHEEHHSKQAEITRRS
jgi:hypothetical protein